MTTSPTPATAANSEAVAWPMHIINLFEQAAKVAAIADRFGRLPDNEPINIVRAGTGREGHMDLITLRRLAALVKAFPPMQALQPHPSQQAGTEVLTIALQEAADAVAFFDRVKAASQDEQIAVGRDHWNRMESALRAVAALAVPA